MERSEFKKKWTELIDEEHSLIIILLENEYIFIGNAYTIENEHYVYLYHDDFLVTVIDLNKIIGLI